MKTKVKVRVGLIEIARIKRGWTKGELARRIDKTPSQVSRVLNGRSLSPSVLKEIANLLGMSLDDVLEA